jgi:hypothetical protein
LKNVLPKMLLESAEAPLFFDNVENLFTIFGIDSDIRTKLLIPLLTSRARASIGRLSAVDLDDYDKVKAFLLKEFKLTPEEYRSRFLSVVKQQDETYQLFASRLANLLNYYVVSRKIDKDFDKLCQVLVADRLKECLPVGTSQYVLSLEGESWFEPSKVAHLADIHVNNKGDYKSMAATNSGPKSFTSATEGKDARSQACTESGQNAASNRSSGTGGKATAGRPAGGLTSTGTERRCYKCKKTGHLWRDCKARQQAEPDASHKVNAVGLCVQSDDRRALASSDTGKPTADVELSTDMEGWGELPNHECVSWSPSPHIDQTVWLPTNVEGVKLRVSPLQYVDVMIDGIKCRALADSGAQIPIIKKSVLNTIAPIGHTQIQGVTGDAETKPLVALDVKLARDPVDDNHVRIHC